MTCRRCLILLGLLLGPAVAASGDAVPAGRSLGVLDNFEAARPGELKLFRQLPGSVIEVIAAPDGDVVEGSRSLRVRIPPTDKAHARPEHQLATINCIYLPPEADAICAKVRVKSGRFTLTFGGPTVYFGNSDVNLEPQTIAGDGKTFLVEWSLHHRPTRNYRRLNAALTYGRDMSFIHYPRWIQEPIRLNLLSPPAGDPGGEFVIDAIELIARGEGRPFPVFADADCVERGAIDFKDGIGSAFTFTLADGRDIRPPARLSHVDADGGKVLRIEAKFVEETSIAGVRVASPPPAETNALAVDLTATHPRRSPIAVDVLLLLASPGTELPAGHSGFDHDLANRPMAGRSYALYHARRSVDSDRIVIPFADFACFFGQGDLKPAMTDNAPVDPSRLLAVGIIVPYGFNSDVSTVTVRKLRWLSVPGEAASLRSYRQPTGKVTITRISEGLYGGIARQEEAGVRPPTPPTPLP